MTVDSGTYLAKDYAQNMLGPLYKNINLDLVGGVFYPQLISMV